jgi:class 3 adenylate cyclase
VLFADVKGSMELAEQLDPEEWSSIMQRFFRILAEGVERPGRAAPRRACNWHTRRRRETLAVNPCVEET